MFDLNVVISFSLTVSKWSSCCIYCFIAAGVVVVDKVMNVSYFKGWGCFVI